MRNTASRRIPGASLESESPAGNSEYPRSERRVKVSAPTTQEGVPAREIQLSLADALEDILRSEK